jgi:transcriptional regulator with XRE-family HTH domain
VAGYVVSRQQALKRLVKQMRKDAHFSQEEVADFLGCSRTRVTEIEREESSATYTQGELELLTVLFGRHPLDMLRLAGPDAIELAERMSTKQTRGALLEVTDCSVPPGLAKILRIDESPGDLIYAPGEQLLASIVDSSMTDDWQEEEPYAVTILCWDTGSGKIISQTRLPYAERIAPLDDGRVVIFTAQPLEAHEAWDYHVSYGQMLVWDTHTGAIEKKMELPYPVGNLAVSPDCAYLAAYLPTNASIQIWQTHAWDPLRAYELGVEPGALSPGCIVGQATDCNDLSMRRKLTYQGFEYRAERFEFLNPRVLVVGFSGETLEIDIQAPDGYAYFQLGELVAIPRVAHTRDDRREITVSAMDFDPHPGGGDSKIELYYQVPKPQEHPAIREVRVTKWVSGQVHQPVILDETCILAWVVYNTPYRWGRFYTRKIGLVNLVSGRVVLLEDQGRGRAEDNQVQATISPKGGMVAYWTFLASWETRLALQHLDPAPLCRKGSSLEVELEKSRQRWWE